MLKKKKIKKVIKGLQKASKTHAKQAKTLKGVINGGSKKKEQVNTQVKNMDVGYIQTKIRETLSALSLRLRVMRKKPWLRLKKYLSRLRGKYKF